MVKKAFMENEFLVALVIIGVSLAIGISNRAFFTVANLFDLLKNSVIMGIFAIGVFIVIVSGGIDVSFTAIAVFSLYVTNKVLVGLNYQGTILLAFLISAGIGTLLGIFNAIFISLYKIPTLIVTLGTQSIYRGFLLAFIGTTLIQDLPSGLIGFSKTYILKATTPNGGIMGLPIAIILLISIVFLCWLLLDYTMLGRGIYALGGDRTAAERAGFNVRTIEFFIYGFVGFLCGIAGIIHSSFARVANPFDLVGNELNVIAAVVLGGTKITGGHGTVLGTVLGVFLVVLVNNSLILLGVPSYWQKAVIGLLILIGTALPAYKFNRSTSRLGIEVH
ncbi:MAG: ABC transporter permease [Firmicutes bacterium]|nr:ABC transporter permease [Bacillota bacterium]